MAELREQTRRQHEALEEKLDWKAICHSRLRYMGLLASFYGFLTTWETVQERNLTDSSLAVLRARLKAPLLDADLRWFGMGQGEIAAIPRIPSAALPFDGEAACLGSFYVIEGSTFGGQLLSRALESGLGLSEGNGYSYFRSYGAGVRQAWVEFGDFVCSRVVTAKDRRDAVAGAHMTFSALEKWLVA